LSALEAAVYEMSLAERRAPVAALAARSVIRACRSGNYFRAAEEALKARDAARSAYMVSIAEDIDRVLTIGTEKITAPYLAAKAAA
jgi:hypothetical protein